MSGIPRVVDAGAMGVGELLTAFDALEVGEAAVFVTGRHPRSLLLEFQNNRAGSFEWSVLEAGPDRFRVEIRRRPIAAPRTVSDYLEFDHRRLDAILPSVLDLLDQGLFAGALDQFAEFACGLNLHIDAEEHVLFPAFEERSGMSSGPTLVMRAEHVEIRACVRAVESALQGRDEPGARNALSRLRTALSDHNLKEEVILYPMTDDVTDASERDALVRQMQLLY